MCNLEFVHGLLSNWFTAIISFSNMSFSSPDSHYAYVGTFDGAPHTRESQMTVMKLANSFFAFSNLLNPSSEFFIYYCTFQLLNFYLISFLPSLY